MKYDSTTITTHSTCSICVGMLYTCCIHHIAYIAQRQDIRQILRENELEEAKREPRRGVKKRIKGIFNVYDDDDDDDEGKKSPYSIFWNGKKPYRTEIRVAKSGRKRRRRRRRRLTGEWGWENVFTCQYATMCACVCVCVFWNFRMCALCASSLALVRVCVQMNE